MLAEIIPKIAGMEQNQYKYNHRCSNATYGEKCIRKQVYEAIGITPEPFPGRTMLVFNDSSWHEELTGDWLRKSMYKLHSQQMEVSPYEINGKKVKGHIDGILTDLEGNDFLFEHKAINHFTFASYETGDLLPYDYIVQCCLYIEGLNKIVGKYLPAILLIKNKNTAQYLEYQIEYDNQEDIAKTKLYVLAYDNNNKGTLKEIKEFFMSDVIKKSIKRFENVDEYVLNKTIPKRQYTIDTHYCDYCQFGSLCWKDYEKEIDNREKIIIEDKETIKKAKQYLNLNEQIGVLENENEQIKIDLQQIMTDKKAYEGIAEDVIIRLKKGEKNTFNKELIPVEMIEKATKKTPYERLTVNKFKEKGEKNNDK